MFTISREGVFVKITTKEEGFVLFGRTVSKQYVVDVMEVITEEINNEYNRAVLFEYEG